MPMMQASTTAAIIAISVVVNSASVVAIVSDVWAVVSSAMVGSVVVCSADDVLLTRVPLPVLLLVPDSL